MVNYKKLIFKWFNNIQNCLVVDDNSKSRAILKKITNNLNINFTGVESGKEAIELIKNNNEFDLIICDEIGYTSLDQKDAELLFELLALRTNKSTIIITNLSFDKWDELFEIKITAITLIDRITYNAHIVNMNGPSYRNKKTVKNE